MYLYLDEISWLHRCHPLVRLLLALVLFVVAFLADQALWQLPLLGVVGVLIATTGAWRNVVRLRFLFFMVALMTFVVWSIFFRGENLTVLLALGPLSFSAEGLRFATAMALKLTVFLAAGTVFLSVTRVEEFAYALTSAGLPYRIGFAVTLSFRLVPVFLESAQKVVQAQRCRGFDFDRGGLLERVRRYIPVMVPVFMGALRRTDGLAMALDARGFQLDRGRTSFLAYPIGVRDLGTLALCAILLVGYSQLLRAGALAAG